MWLCRYAAKFLNFEAAEEKTSWSFHILDQVLILSEICLAVQVFSGSIC